MGISDAIFVPRASKCEKKKEIMACKSFQSVKFDF